MKPLNLRTLLLALLALGLAPAARAAVTISLGTLAPEGTTYHKSLLELRESWRSNGVTLRLYAGGKLGGEAKMVSQMRQGALDAAMLTATGLTEIEPAVTGLQSIPMFYRTLEEVDYVGEKLAPLLEKRMEAKGFIVLFWSDAGWVNFFSKKPILTPDDLKKTKLFVWAGDTSINELWRTRGYQPVPLETADIVPMLDTGLIQCVPMPPFAALAAQIYDRAPHMLQLNYAVLKGALVVRKAAWDRVPVAARPALLEAAAITGRANKAQARAERQKSIDAMKAKGLTVHTVSPEMEVQWREEAAGFYPKLRGGFIPEDIFAAVEKHVQEFRARPSAAKP
jgi:TRAP-type C4-dicarboxylate transport system substrate-binding protein